MSLEAYMTPAEKLLALHEQHLAAFQRAQAAAPGTEACNQAADEMMTISSAIDAHAKEHKLRMHFGTPIPKPQS